MSAPQPPAEALRYSDSGVSIDAGNALVERIKRVAARTHGPQVLAGLGGFGALYELPLTRYQKPVLVSAADGVGTKLKLATQQSRHGDIGRDVGARGGKDGIDGGAEPREVIDDVATGARERRKAEAVSGGIARG
ncbi:MAG: phosphoribosylformylglycinamidine cyclo-ligase, partial [bacterium]